MPRIVSRSTPELHAGRERGVHVKVVVPGDRGDGLVDLREHGREPLATASHDGTARLWNADGSGLVVLRGHADRAYAVAFSPDGQRVATASGDRTARVWDLDPAVVRAQLESATTLCLPVQERMQSVGEELHEACAAFATCEREHGRRPIVERGWLVACE